MFFFSLSAYNFAEITMIGCYEEHCTIDIITKQY